MVQLTALKGSIFKNKQLFTVAFKTQLNATLSHHETLPLIDFWSSLRLKSQASIIYVKQILGTSNKPQVNEIRTYYKQNK